jgi:tetratricopeptide (TPR) repeat protein
MRYIPNLIPEDRRVLPEYFKSNPYALSEKSSVQDIIGYIGAVVIFLIGTVSLPHPLISILLFIVGFTLLPPGHNWLERNFRFKLTNKIKIVFCCLLILLTLPLVSHYGKIDSAVMLEQRIKEQIKQKSKLAEDAKEQKRKDNYNALFASIVELENKNNTNQALILIDSTMRIANSTGEKDSLTHEKNNIARANAFALVKKGKYKDAIPLLAELLSSSSDKELLYNRAVCLYKTGNIKDAVADLKFAMQKGSEEANILHEKINPIRKRIIGYTTLCCDGTTSSARGRGACSWHGGVCNWNDPIYDEYRKYE